MRCFFGVLGAGVILGTVYLYLMSYGVLVRSEVRKAEEYKPAGDVLFCHYLIGTEVAPVEYWASTRAICPRLYRF